MPLRERSFLHLAPIGKIVPPHQCDILRLEIDETSFVARRTLLDEARTRWKRVTECIGGEVSCLDLEAVFVKISAHPYLQCVQSTMRRGYSRWHALT